MLCVLVCCGCVGSNPPSWFLNPQTSSDKFYGVGVGASLAQAKQVAMNDLAQSVQAQVSSNTNLTHIQSDDLLSTNLSQDITLNVTSLDLPNLKVSNQSYTKGEYYVQVSISKKDLLTPLINDYTSKVNTLKSISQTSCGALNLPEFYRLNKETKILNNLYQTIKTIAPNQILDSAPSQFDSVLAENLPLPKVQVVYQGSLDSYQHILSGEIAKFFRISNEGNLPIMENSVSITTSQTSLKNTYEIQLNSVIKDCQGNVVFQTLIKEQQDSKENVFKRAGVVLYKKLLEYQSKDTGIPQI